jgi:predicted glycosyltransferase involved in capsule biosynthesis
MKKNFSYIIGYRQVSEERKQNLYIVLEFLSKLKENFEIILVQQDSKQSEIKYFEGLRNVFVFNDNLYNRSWGFNVGANLSNSDILVFADSDVIIKHDDLLKSVDECNKSEAVDPKGSWLYLEKTEKDVENPKKFSIRKGYNFSSGICLIKKDKFFTIGGWEEDMQGWGGEDDLMTHKIKNMLDSNKKIDCKVLHLFHLEVKLSQIKNELFYKKNLEILRKIQSMNRIQLYEYYRNKKIGLVNKYEVQK